ncbi:rCG57372 [Rattus norvegicus]|uniref:RCG57372 n=1 Tax=Rattus norvegicus TaxID=10116 RepID=A6JP32_RAT|nr:rCG57372 [Rattus norvegicus]
MKVLLEGFLRLRRAHEAGQWWHMPLIATFGRQRHCRSLYVRIQPACTRRMTH